MPSASLSPNQKRYLRGLAHALKPVILVGGKGVSVGVLGELGRALDDHELVKVRLAGEDRGVRTESIERLVAGTGAVLVQRVGHTAVLYRPNPERAGIVLPNRCG